MNFTDKEVQAIKTVFEFAAGSIGEDLLGIVLYTGAFNDLEDSQAAVVNLVRKIERREQLVRDVSLEDAAAELAARHFEIEEGMRRIFRLRAPEREDSIVLLEVNENTVAAGFCPIGFPPNEVYPYRMVIVEVTPDEFEFIDDLLPIGWHIREEFPHG